MSKRHVLTAAGLVLAVAAGFPALAQVHASPRASLVHQVQRAHKQLAAQKTQTGKLRQQVDALKRKALADQQSLKQSDATIAQLRSELKQLARHKATAAGH